MQDNDSARFCHIRVFKQRRNHGGHFVCANRRIIGIVGDILFRRSFDFGLGLGRWLAATT